MQDPHFWNRIYDSTVSDVHPVREDVYLDLRADAAVVGMLTVGNRGAQERRDMASPSTRPPWN